MLMSAANPGSIKLINFGLAEEVEGDTCTLTGFVGSSHYLAPEIYPHKPDKNVAEPKPYGQSVNPRAGSL